jgi:hypothetical protein
MEILGYDHVQLAMPAGGEERAVAFFEGLLGLRVVPKPQPLASRGGCWFEGDGIKLHLGVEADFRPARKAHPALVVDDLATLVEILEGAGFEVRSGDEVRAASNASSTIRSATGSSSSAVPEARNGPSTTAFVKEASRHADVPRMSEFAGWHQRIGQRYDVDGGIPVMWGGSGKGRATLARVVNVSVTGAGVVASDESRAEVGDEWLLTMGETSAMVKVREIRDLGSKGTLYYGVEFLSDTPDELIQVLNEVIESQSEEQLETVWNRSV